MEIIDFILHIDKHLAWIVNEYQTMTYVILFLIVFAETGLVVTPFLPGDSLLFAVGALAASDMLNIWYVTGLLLIAAIVGDTVNYHIGKYVGPKILRSENSLFLHKEHLVKAQAFYEKHGGKTIVMARFLPIVRTFAPFVAGVGHMKYSDFIFYNIVGAFLWCGIFLGAGYFFGNLPYVKENFTLVILAIIAISVIPAVIDVVFHIREKRKSSKRNK